MDTTEFRTLAENLMRDHYLHGWRFAWARGKRQAGLCTYRTKTLSFSREWVTLNDEPMLRNLITHEIAHALVGHSAGHGWKWAQVHRSLGGDGQRCIDTASQEGVVAPSGRYVGTCPGGHQHTAHRVLKEMTRRCCSACAKSATGRAVFDSRFLITWTDTETGRVFGTAPVRQAVAASTVKSTTTKNFVPVEAPPWVTGSSDWDKMFDA